MRKCPTPLAILLAGSCDSVGVLRFPPSSPVLPGFVVPVLSDRDIAEVLTTHLCHSLQFDLSAASQIQIDPQFGETLVTEIGERATLYLGKIDRTLLAPQPGWKTLSEILRFMPKNKPRVAYMKAMQKLSGSDLDTIEAVEIKG